MYWRTRKNGPYSSVPLSRTASSRYLRIICSVYTVHDVAAYLCFSIAEP